MRDAISRALFHATADTRASVTLPTATAGAAAGAVVRVAMAGALGGVVSWAAVFGAVILVSAASAAAPGAGGASGPSRSGPPLPVALKGRPDQRERMPAKELFGHQREAAPLRPAAIGFYSRGCLAGAERLEIDGPAWQAMRLSRNRHWGHPKLVRLVRRLASDAKKLDGWPGLLVGDMSQPRGGPMLTGHRSHQIGLDADIWFTPMPSRRLSWRERERKSAVSMLAADRLSVNADVWTLAHARLIRRAASYPETERVLVHPAIKKALCEGAEKLGGDRSWLAKVRPYWGHHYHFHLRIGCPPGSAGCRAQKPVTGDDGCKEELAYWYQQLTRPKPRVAAPAKKVRPRPPLTLAGLPAECRGVLDAQRIVAPAPVPAQR